MATYTDNYNLIKPTYAETADIVPLNNNFEKIDEVMHASQTSLAPAYDQTANYQPGDVVMYELNMYKCTGATSGTWDPSKWTRTTAAETGGGGSVDLDIYGEASGTAEASFSDGAEASLVECEIGIVPSQDLHGYSKPWAGGAGKNLFSGTSELSGFSESSGIFTNTLTDSKTNLQLKVLFYNGSTLVDSSPNLDVTSAGRVSISRTISSTITKMRLKHNGSQRDLYFDFPFDKQGVYTISLNVIGYDPTTIGGISFDDVMIESGSSMTTYEPYSNICPISGHTDVTVTVASTSGGSGDDTTVSLGRTVYGGTLNVNTGELTVTHELVTAPTRGSADSSGKLYTLVFSPSIGIKSWGQTEAPSTYIASNMFEVEGLSEARASEDKCLVQYGTAIYAGGYIGEESALDTLLSTLQIKYELATPQTFTLSKKQIQTLLGQNYVSHDGGGTISLVYVKGDAPIKPNPTDAEIPLTGIEIDGKKFSIPNGERTQNRLWSYMINNGGTIVYDGSIISLSDNITNYDELVVEVVSAQQDLSDNWRGSTQIRINVEALINAINPYNMVICTYDNRSSKLTFTTNTLQKTMGLGDINGIVNVYGIKYNG